jgi:hypothetical protein
MGIFYSKEIMYLRKTFCLQIFAYGKPSKNSINSLKIVGIFSGFLYLYYESRNSREGDDKNRRGSQRKPERKEYYRY